MKTIVSIKRDYRPFVWAGLPLAVLCAELSGTEVTLTLVPVGGLIVDGKASVLVEGYWTTHIATRHEGGQWDVPCIVNGSIAGTMTATGGCTDCNMDGNNGNQAGTIPFLFGPGGLSPYLPGACITATTPPISAAPIHIALGVTRYIGAVNYSVSDCAAGDFNIFFECTDQPGGLCDEIPEPTNTTRYREDVPIAPPAGPLLSLTMFDTTLTVPTGSCCELGTCVEDGINRICCEQNHPGATFVVNKTCGDPDPCSCVACQCDPAGCCLPDLTCASLDADCCVAAGGTPNGENFCAATLACCLPDGVCSHLSPTCCTAADGIRLNSTVCAASQGCCLPDGHCVNTSPVCCLAKGGTSFGIGTSCGIPQSCCLNGAECADTDPFCCTGLGGTQGGPGSSCSPHEACCFSEALCLMKEPVCCGGAGGVPKGPLTTCDAQPVCCDTVFSAVRTAQSKGSHVYWSEFLNQRILRADLDGSNVEVVLSTVGSPRGIALDLIAGKLYWIEYPTVSTPTRIRRANLDGSQLEDFITGNGILNNIAVDAVLGKIYWNISSGGIGRADLNGSNVELIATQSNPGGLALDAPNGRIFWASGGVRRANLDGTHEDPLVNGFDVRGVALDPYRERVYWTENPAVRKVRSATLNGNDVIDVVVFQDQSHGIAVDSGAGKIYWAAGLLYRANLDGSEIEELPADNPFGIALDTRAAEDCQPNGHPDVCDLANGTSADCNTNEIPDECDIADGTLTDADGNGFPDECVICGDGDCDPSESGCNCPQDCGPPNCDDGLFCTGIESCDPALGCVSPGNPCDPGLDCDEATDSCVVPPIPTVSSWGLVVIGLLILSVWKIRFGPRWNRGPHTLVLTKTVSVSERHNHENN